MSDGWLRSSGSDRLCLFILLETNFFPLLQCSANMSSSVGPSKNMSIEEQARQKSKSFWEVNPEMEDAEATELARAGDADFQLEMENAEDTSGDGDATTTNGGDHTDIGAEDHTDVADGGNPPRLRSLRSRGRTGHRKRSPPSLTRSPKSRVKVKIGKGLS